ncbi:MAG: hypothetical protein Q9220_000850 [cf. Caloplaca sp. 1 TL-2023]
MPAADEKPDEGTLRQSISPKAVVIAEPESFLPASHPELEDHVPSNLSLSPKKHRASLNSRRLSGRPAPCTSAAPLQSTASLDGNTDDGSTNFPQTVRERRTSTKDGHHHTNQILSQVRDWLHQEKARASRRKSKLHHGHSKTGSATGLVKGLVDHVHHDLSKGHGIHHRRRSSDLSEEAIALEKLEEILDRSLQLDEDAEIASDRRKPSTCSRRSSIKRMLRKKSTGVSSDTDNQDNDIRVPSAEVVLDNSKTLSYTGGAASSQLDLADSMKKASKKEKEAWLKFKDEIVRLAHTLRLKGWRRVPLDKGADIDVERLSGAMTNAVYVVSPPKDLHQTPHDPPNSTVSQHPKTPPVKLLLRIYGPQVEHLIDRDVELQILRRLARKRIGPRLLGTFTNGRFEEFFNAQTLTAKDLRMPETSKQIAKRMRELHEGVELLEEERDAGPFLWQNWDKWVGKCEEVITRIDREMVSDGRDTTRTSASSEDFKKYGFICGVEWPMFRRTVERYRKWLYEHFGGPRGIRSRLVFAHNDTQYGNLLRLQPAGESPLLHPANEHKQLVVIDFEYASANMPGLEFANHFTEWCYNYHIARPHALNQRLYPTVDEQHRFLKAYVQHQPFRPSLSRQGSSTSIRPVLSHSISSFVLDSRAPPAQLAEDEKRREEMTESEIQRLMLEARMWRPANSAQWVAWGIVQAKVPGMGGSGKSSDDEETSTGVPDSDPLSLDMEKAAKDLKDKRPEEGTSTEDGNEEDEFDYLGYSRERAMLFWGDMLQLGLVGEEELPAELGSRVKIVEY